MLARDAVITVVDFEGTGVVPPHPDEPWQIGLVQLRRGRMLKASRFTSLLRVDARPFSRHAPGRHAQLRAEMAAAPRLPELWASLQARLDGPVLAAHNIGTEQRFLRAAFPMHAFAPWIDTLKLVRLVAPDLRSHRLESVIARLGLESRVKLLVPDREPHDALFDAVSAAAVLEFLLAQPEWRAVSVEALVQARPERYHRRVAQSRAFIAPPGRRVGSQGS